MQSKIMLGETANVERMPTMPVNCLQRATVTFKVSEQLAHAKLTENPNPLIICFSDLRIRDLNKKAGGWG